MPDLHLGLVLGHLSRTSRVGCRLHGVKGSAHVNCATISGPGVGRASMTRLLLKIKLGGGHE